MNMTIGVGRVVGMPSAPPTAGCWPWPGRRSASGYGVLWIRGRGDIRAHRLLWELAHGPVPADADVLHWCDNPPCVNPAHLHLGTHTQNMAEMVVRGRVRRGEEHRDAKLTENSVREMRAIYALGEVSTTDLGERYGVSRHTAWLVVAHKSWRHVQ